MMPSIYKEIHGFTARYSSHKEVIEKLYLKAFINSFERLRSIKGINSFKENDIRDRFQYDFENSNPVIIKYIANRTITFNSESQIIEEHEKYRTDIKLFCAWYREHFVIECKLLRFASQVYIKGRYDKNKCKYEVNGIERFVTLTYSKHDQYAGMLGFIIKGIPERIIENLKTKVSPFYPSHEMQSLLNQKCGGWALSFQSKHLRQDDRPIHLYHLFFDFRE